MISKQSAIAWLVILIVLCSLSTYQIKQHWRIQTDILALLPQRDDEPLVQIIRRMVSGELGRTALFLVSHASLRLPVTPPANSANSWTRVVYLPLFNGTIANSKRHSLSFTSHSAINSLAQPFVHI